MAAPVEQYMNDTLLNVVDFFKAESMGRVRHYAIVLDALSLDDGLTASDVHAEFRLSRVGSGLLAEGTVRATVELTCVRTLEPFPEDVEAEFAEQFRPTIDLSTGRKAVYEDEREEEIGEIASDYFVIGENHDLDMAEPLRQVIIVALPMQPVKPGTTPIHYDEDEGADTDAVVAIRPNPFAVLGTLLREDEK